MDAVSAAASGVGVGTVAIAAAVLLVLYALACALWPFTAHGRCSGTGKLRSPGGKAWRRCPGCGGSGTKLRAGRRLFNTTRRRP